MNPAMFKQCYNRIKEIGRRGQYDGPHVGEASNLAEKIFADGTPAQKGALTRLYREWADYEYMLDAGAYGVY